MEREDGRKVFLMAGRKRKKTTGTSYIMTTDPANKSRKGAAFRGLLHSNLLGTHFRMVGRKEARLGRKTGKRKMKARKGELGAVVYNTNVLGFNGPRFMTGWYYLWWPGLLPGFLVSHLATAGPGRGEVRAISSREE